jgi:hypothetical protein
MPQVDHLELNMPLSSYNVNQQLINHFNQFLHLPHLFPTLKSYLVNKSIIPDIHQLIIQEVNAIKEVDKKEAQDTLEHQFSQEQFDQDKAERERDEREDARQNSELIRLQDELTQQTATLFNTRGQIAALEIFIARKAHEHTHSHTHGTTHAHPSITNRTVHNHPKTTQHTHHHAHTHGHSTSTHHHHVTDLNNIRLKELQHTAVCIMARISNINSRVAQIQQQAQQRYQNRVQHNIRLQARMDLEQHKPGITLYNTLSAYNKTQLTKKIHNSNEALEAKSKALIAQAAQQNYSVFMQQLELSLNSLKLSAAEIEALRHTIKFMNRHFKQVKAASGIQSELTQINHSIASLQAKVQRDNARVESLLHANPSLTQQNASLTAKNTELSITQQGNHKSRDKFITPTWILASIALVTCIPLFLTIGGVIPMILAPAVLYTLMSIIPTLSLLASIGTGITALVFAIKEKLNHDEQQGNIKTININNAQMGLNDQERVQLQTTTIPSCLREINENTHQKARLEHLLAEQSSLAEQSLHQAHCVDPLSYQSLYPTLPKPQSEAPPSYEASTGCGFFKQMPPPAYYLVEPSAPPLELLEDSLKPSMH